MTLWLFGGVIRLAGEANTPKAALRIAVSGPLMRLRLAGSLQAPLMDSARLGAAHIILGVAWWPAGINLLQSLLNLLPGARWTAGGS